MPFLVRYPALAQRPEIRDAMVTNVDFAPTLLDLAGVPIPDTFQGRSAAPLLRGEAPLDWPTAMYYRYWMHMDAQHKVWAHLGIRTLQYKLIYYYGEALDTVGSTDEPTPKTWELFDLERDPLELTNLYDDPAYGDVVRSLKEELARLQASLGDTDPDTKTGG